MDIELRVQLESEALMKLFTMLFGFVIAFKLRTIHFIRFDFTIGLIVTMDCFLFGQCLPNNQGRHE